MLSVPCHAVPRCAVPCCAVLRCLCPVVLCPVVLVQCLSVTVSMTALTRVLPVAQEASVKRFPTALKPSGACRRTGTVWRESLVPDVARRQCTLQAQACGTQLGRTPRSTEGHAQMTCRGACPGGLSHAPSLPAAVAGGAGATCLPMSQQVPAPAGLQSAVTCIHHRAGALQRLCS